MKLESGITFLLLMVTSMTTAQIKGVVINMETGIPARQVLVYSDKGEQVETAWDGTFQLNDTTFHRLTLGNGEFVSRVMYREELTDTIALIPNLNALCEVVVIGYDRRKKKAGVFAVPIEELKALDRASPNSGFSMGDIKRLRKKARHKHIQKILDNY
jgi:hypothetical protein